MLLLIDGNRGIYIPHVFAEYALANEYPIIGLEFTNREQFLVDLVPLSKGPGETTLYWEIWEDVVSNAIFHLDGQTLYLVEDGDLWLSTHDENDNDEDSSPHWINYQDYLAEMGKEYHERIHHLIQN